MKRLLIISVLLLSSSAANAGILIEPYVGFGIGSGEDGDTPKTEYDLNSPFIGGRLGYQALGFMAGLDYTKGMESDFESKTSGTTSKVDGDQQTIGAFVGYNLPALLRVWVGYYFSHKIEVQSGSSVGDEFKGGGYGLGVGFTALPLLSINLEYRMHTLDEYKDASTGSTSALNGNNEIDFNQIMISASLPLDI